MAKAAQIKTKDTKQSVDAFIETVPDEQKQKDSQAIIKLMQKATKEAPRMWGSSIIGFGHHRYKSPQSGREVDWFVMGFSPRKAALVLYLTTDVSTHAALLQKLGKHKTGVGCLYINKLADVDVKVLEEMITATAKKKSMM